jgi:hypothetical protein
LRDWIYSAIEGAATAFAIVTGVVEANLPASVILLLGLASLAAPTFWEPETSYLELIWRNNPGRELDTKGLC